MIRNGWQTITRQDGSRLLVMWHDDEPKEAMRVSPPLFPAYCLLCQREHRPGELCAGGYA